MYGTSGLIPARLKQQQKRGAIAVLEGNSWYLHQHFTISSHQLTASCE